MIPFLRCGLGCLIGGGFFLTLLLFDRSAFQTFREPKFLAMIWIGAAGAALWGGLVWLQVFRNRRVSLPPRPLIALLPLFGLVGYHIYLAYGGVRSSSFRSEGVPLQVQYFVHILLPAIAWLILFSIASFAFRTRISQERLLTLLFAAFSIEVLVVVLEILQNATGLPLNPVSWVSQGEIEVFGQTVKERIFGTIGNPNWVAGYFSIAVLPLFAWGIHRKTRWIRYPVLFVLVVSLFALVTTRSKGALLAFAVGVVHFGVVSYLYRRKHLPAGGKEVRFVKKNVAIVVFLVFLALAGGMFVANQGSKSNSDSYLKRWTETFELRGDSITVRALLAYCGFRMWESAPWAGLGPGEFKIHFLDTLRDLVESPEGEPIRARVARLHSLRATHLHSEYLQTLVEFGILGLVFVELFFIWCQCRAVRSILNTDSWREAVIRTGFLSGVWAGFGGSLFDYPFHRPAQAYLLAVFLGVALSRQRRSQRENGRGKRVLSAGGFLWGGCCLVLALLLFWQAEAKYVAQRLGFWGKTTLELAGGDASRAYEALATAQDLVPAEGEYTLWLAYYYLAAKRDPNLAIRQIRKARKISDNPNRILLEATAQLERNDRVTAAQLLRFVETLEPHKVGVQFLKGRVLQEQGRWEEACRAFLTEIQNSKRSPDRRSPHLEESYLRLASILEKELGRYEEAAKYYRGFLRVLGDRIPSFPEARLRLADLSLNRFYDLETAEEYYRQALHILKENGDSREAKEVEKVLEEIQNRREQFR